MSLPANALTTVETVQAEGRALANLTDGQATRLISTASEMVESFINRKLPLATIIEQHDGARGTIKLVLDRWPIVGTLSTITITEFQTPLDAGTTIINDGSDFVIEDAARGALHRDRGWASSDLGGLGAAYEPVVGVARQRYTVTYSGGYVLPGTRWSPTTPFVDAGLAQATTPASNVNVFRAGGAGVTGSSEPTWPAVGSTVTDGSITWTNLGPRTLPYPLEQACIDIVADLWLRRATGRGYQEEGAGGARRTYVAAAGVLSPAVQQLLWPYRRIF